ncbi:MAG: hypothetical protein NXI14_09095 [bacterium]|nr:hypothetical protein [bacterium]
MRRAYQDDWEIRRVPRQEIDGTFVVAGCVNNLPLTHFFASPCAWTAGLLAIRHARLMHDRRKNVQRTSFSAQAIGDLTYSGDGKRRSSRNANDELARLREAQGITAQTKEAV